MNKFKGKVVWVTGSSTGVGREIAIVHKNKNIVEAEKTLQLVNVMRAMFI